MSNRLAWRAAWGSSSSLTAAPDDSLPPGPAKTCFIARLSHRVLDRAQALDLDPDHVAGLQEPGRIERHPDSVRRPGPDQIAGPQGACLGDEIDQPLTAEDQVRGAAVLAELPVDPGAQTQIFGVGHLLSSGHPRAERTEAVGALRARPLRLAALQVAPGDIVGDA